MCPCSACTLLWLQHVCQCVGKTLSARDSSSAVSSDIPTYQPTADQFDDVIAYIESIAADAQRYGMCRILPPADSRKVRWPADSYQCQSCIVRFVCVSLGASLHVSWLIIIIIIIILIIIWSVVECEICWCPVYAGGMLCVGESTFHMSHSVHSPAERQVSVHLRFTCLTRYIYRLRDRSLFIYVSHVTLGTFTGWETGLCSCTFHMSHMMLVGPVSMAVIEIMIDWTVLLVQKGRSVFIRWGPNAVLTACIRRHIEKQGGKLDTNPMVCCLFVSVIFISS